MLPQMLANEIGAGYNGVDALSQLSSSAGRGANHQRTIRHGVGDAFVFLCARQQARRTHRRARFAKSYVVRLHYSEMLKSEVGHDAGGRTDVERVARGDQHDAQVIEFEGAQQTPILRIDGFEQKGIYRRVR